MPSFMLGQLRVFAVHFAAGILADIEVVRIIDKYSITIQFNSRDTASFSLK